jgi:hypothetical protein
MKILLATMLATAALYTSEAMALEPIEGSITYRNPDVRMGFRKVPAGSSFEHRFYDNGGSLIVETYRIRPDGTLQLIERVHREHG